MPDAQQLGLLGTASSAFIAAASYWSKVRHERRRSTRTALYYLLEVHHHLSRLLHGLKTMPPRLTERCSEVFTERGIGVSEAEKKALAAALDLMMKSYAQSELRSLAESVSAPFAQVLAEVAREDPVLAFELRGRDQLVVGAYKYFDMFDRQQLAAEREKPEVKKALDDLIDFLQEAALEQLRAAIRATAWKCDLTTTLRTLWIVRREERGTASGELQRMADRYLEQVLEPFLEQVASAASTAAAAT